MDSGEIIYGEGHSYESPFKGSQFDAAETAWRHSEQLYRRAVKQGDTRAIVNLAALVARRGEAAEAEQWYRRAADQGHAGAMLNLAVLLEDREEAAEAEPDKQFDLDDGARGLRTLQLTAAIPLLLGILLGTVPLAVNVLRSHRSAWTPPAAPAAAPLRSATVREQRAKFLADVHQRIDSDGDEIRGLSDPQLLALGRAACRQPGIVQTRTQLRSLQRSKFLAAARVYLCGRPIPAARPVPDVRSGEAASSLPRDVRAGEPVRRPAVDSRRTAIALFCRDLNARGYSYSGAVDYWRRNGQPRHMDADGNGRPCETVYPLSDVSRYWRHSPAVSVPERSLRPPTRSGGSPTPTRATPDQGTASASPPGVASATQSAPATPAPTASATTTPETPPPPSVDRFSTDQPTMPPSTRPQP